MTRFDVVRNDLRPSVKAQLKWKDGKPVNLTGCTVKFHMSDLEDTVLIDEVATVLLPEADGYVQYDWQDARAEKPRDTNHEPNDYPAEFEVTFDDGKNLTFPTEKNLVIVIRKEIA